MSVSPRRSPLVALLLVAAAGCDPALGVPDDYGDGTKLAALADGGAAGAGGGGETRCTPGTRRCTLAAGTAAFERCDESGAGWLSDMCPEGQVCGQGGACLAPVCVAGTARCEPDRSVCAADRLSWQPAPCGSGQKCVASGAGATCVAHACDPGVPACSPDGKGTIQCSADGTQATVVACPAGQACVGTACKPTTFAPGQVVVVEAAQTPLALPGGDYWLAVVDTASSSSSAVPFPATLSGTISNVVTPQPSALPVAARGPGFSCTRARADAVLASAQRRTMVPPPPPAPQAYAVGDTRTFYYPDFSSGSLASVERTGRLRKTSAGANYWEDQTTAAPGTLIGDSELTQLAARVDEGVLPRNVGIFGPFTDVDGNGKIDVFFTDLITDADNTEAFVTLATLYPPGTFGATFDHGEVIYVSNKTTSPGPLAGVMAHELQHLIYFGTELAPYLPDDLLNAPDLSGDAYAVEGIAELAHAWSGQDGAWFGGYALQAPEEWSLARLLAAQYVDDPEANATLYGFGGLFHEYLFDQAGAVSVQGKGTIVDLGGFAQNHQFQSQAGGTARLRPVDGRTLADAYTHFAAALLVASMPTSLSGAAAADPRWKFRAPTNDGWWGGTLGGAPGASSPFGTMPIDGWTQHASTLRAGGLHLYSATASGQATLRITRASTRVVVVRAP